MTRAYVSAKVNNELQYKLLRDQLWEIVNGDKYYKKVNPHMTIVPPFGIKDGSESHIEDIVKSSKLKGKQIDMDAISVYENIHKPYVVLLYADIDMSDERAELLNQLDEYADGHPADLHDPHITLLKTQGWWKEPEQELKNKLQHEIMNRQSIMSTEISRLKVDFRT